jgi:hypothetical protein
MKKKIEKKSHRSTVEHVHIGDIMIDTGTLIMADPCRIDEMAEAWNESLTNENGPETICPRQNGMGFGVALPTGLGDGIYPVYAAYETTAAFGRRISHIHIEFTNPLRGTGCSKEFPHKAEEICSFGSIVPEARRYVTGIPRKPLPKGVVLVHNHVVPQQKLGMKGFRAWTQNLTDDLEVCPCDWAGVNLRGLVHYRGRRIGVLG